MSMIGELTFFLGLQVKQKHDGMFLSQEKYAKNLVERFGLATAKPYKTLMSSSIKISRDGTGECVDHTLYRSMIGSLLYLSATRPDIMYSVCVCARYQADPRTSHLTAVKRIHRYISGTASLGIWYYRDTNANLVGYSDSD